MEASASVVNLKNSITTSMCYDISFQVNIRQLTDYFPGLIYDSQTMLDFPAFDHVQGVGVFQEHPVIYINREDALPHCRMMSWGVVEHFQKAIPDWKKRNGMLNIRAERIFGDKKSYWHKIRNRRCLVPVSGIFEHRAVPGQKKKVPYWVRPRGEEIFFLPGLYSVTKLHDAENDVWYNFYTHAIITREANALMKQIHNDGDNQYRMPLFLPKNMAETWLHEDLSSNEVAYQSILDYEMPPADMEYKTVWTIRTTKERPDGVVGKDEAFCWPGVAELVY